MFMAQDSRLVEYDEGNDEYTVVSSIPEDDSIDEQPVGGYGAELVDLAADFPVSIGQHLAAIYGDIIYTARDVGSLGGRISSSNLDGTYY